MVVLDDDPGRHSCRRQFEWTQATALALFGLHVMFFPETFVVSKMSSMSFMFDAENLGRFCFVVGASRGFLLFLNGRLGLWGPPTRALASTCTLVVLAQIGISLTANLSPGMWFYFVYAGSEFLTIRRAKRDYNGILRVRQVSAA